MAKAGILSLLFLAQLNAYWPANEGSWIRYQALRVLAYWDVGSRQLSVLQRYPQDDNHFVQIRWVDSPTLAPSFNEEFGIGAATEAAGALGNMQFQFAGTGQWMIGEVGRVDKEMIVVPPEPKLPVNPAPQGVLTTQHQAMYSGSGAAVTWPMLTKFATIGHWDKWGAFSDVWWTSLEEVDTAGKSLGVYNYAFAKGIGLVNFWYVNEWPFDANHMAWGWEYYAIDWSR